MLFSQYSSLSARVSTDRTGDRLVFSETYQENEDKTTSELVLFDRRTGEKRRLTTGSRAVDPALSPDGTTIAYVKIKPYAKAASSTTPVRAPGRFLRGSL